jgi:hypothetical protein
MMPNEPRFLNLRDGGNLPEKPMPIWPFIIALALFIALTLHCIDNLMTQATYDQINAGRSDHVCGKC